MDQVNSDLILISLFTDFDLWKMLSPLCYFFLIIAIQVNANTIPAVSNTTENEFEVCNASEITYKKCYIFSWLTQWQNCFFNDPSEDVGHFFLTRLINCGGQISGINLVKV